MDADPYEFLVDDDGKNESRLPGTVIAVIAVLLGLAVVAIFALLGLRCSKKYTVLKKKSNRGSRYGYV